MIRRRRALGLNGRNAHIARNNPRWAIAEVKDKIVCKVRLAAADIAVPPTLHVVSSRREMRALPSASLPDRFVAKPARGSQGKGVVVVTGRRGHDVWVTPDGLRSHRQLEREVDDMIDGIHSDTDTDRALFEPLLVAHPDLAALAPFGLPDIRIVCDDGRPLMAMMRVPTLSSGGRGNLHQGGLGAAIDISTGRIERAVVGGAEVARHPDTGAPMVDAIIPRWPELVDLARRCGPATGLGYVGADLVVDAEFGALVLEVNAHPGLEIQNVCLQPLDPGGGDSRWK
jgi:alpha-L-glutamate ligase-like protein